MFEKKIWRNEVKRENFNDHLHKILEFKFIGTPFTQTTMTQHACLVVSICVKWDKHLILKLVGNVEWEHTRKQDPFKF